MKYISTHLEYFNNYFSFNKVNKDTQEKGLENTNHNCKQNFNN